MRFHRVTLEWEDGRYAGPKTSLEAADKYNEHRKTECPSNHIPYEDTLHLWKPDMQVLKALTVVIHLPIT